MPINRLYDAVVDRLPAPVQPLARRMDPAFLRFGVVGAVGFIVDLVFLSLLVRFAGWSPIPVVWPILSFVLTIQMQARFVSFPIAVASTWALNRNWTFKQATTKPIHHEVASYVAVQGSGGLANVGAYCLVLYLVPALQAWPIIPLMVGSGLGLCLTFVGSKYWAFRDHG